MKEELNIELLDAEKIAFIKDQVEQNQRFHLECSDALREQANKVLAAIIVSSSALIGFGVTSASQNLPLSLGALSMGMHLSIAGAFLTWRGMRADDVQALGNEPDSLLRNENLRYSTTAMIAGELLAKQSEILLQKLRNSDRGSVLNRAIKSVFLSPITFLITFSITAAVAAACHQSAFLDQAVAELALMAWM